MKIIMRWKWWVPALALSPGLNGGCTDYLVVPADGMLTLTAASTAIYSDETVAVTVCGRTVDGFPVRTSTQFWLATDLGRLTTSSGGGEQNETEQDTSGDSAETGPNSALVLSADDGGCATNVTWTPDSGGTTATLSAWSGKTATASQTVTVKSRAAGIWVYPSTAVVGPDGGSLTATAVVTDADGETVEGVGVLFTSVPICNITTAQGVTGAEGTVSTGMDVTTDVVLTAALLVPEGGTADAEIGLAAPVLMDATPHEASWSADLRITLAGSGFSSHALVRVGDLVGTITESSETSLVVSIPDPAVTVATTYSVTVHNPSGAESTLTDILTLEP